ncbi:HPP family protein [Azospirillum sp. ST 5-10]|uniref:HPP family protein n=1 Tax=unclassified Azospirillum TaxID=2630922 RepID=UPI003F49F567
MKSRSALFRPILAGAHLQDRLVGCGGALLGIALTGLICRNVLSSPALVAPMGATAVLLYAIPSSPLAQPWPIIGGNTLSALVGVLVARFIPDPMLAGALAVAVAIAVMSVTRCLHPPGGAAALTAVLAGPQVIGPGFDFVLSPVAINSALMVAAGWAFHRFSGHSYPHVTAAKPVGSHATADPPPQMRVGITTDDLDEAIEDFGEALDISSEDLQTLFLQAELRAMERLKPDIRSADIMSRAVVAVGMDEVPSVAREKLVAHGFRTLPVVDARSAVVGMVGHGQLARPGLRIADIMVPAITARPDTPAFHLLRHLSDGRVHEVMIVDPQQALLGIVTQTDLLVALARAALTRSARHAA